MGILDIQQTTAFETNDGRYYVPDVKNPVANTVAVIRISPTVDQWSISYMAINCSNASQPVMCFVYRNQIGARYIVEATLSGLTNVSDTVHGLTPGESLYIVWYGGVDGSTATVNARGTKTDRVGGFRAIP